MGNDQNTIEFVRQTLGCDCPDEVFEQIEYGAPGHFAEPHIRRITVGGRLLIHIWAIMDLSFSEARLQAMLTQGKKERDQRGLNRFRAVLATDDVAGIRPVAEQVFQGVGDKDEKMHLHVLRLEDVAEVG